ncbi:TPA: anthranilate phosphoribosyltransferase [bacterium]|nr:anthranilate phosphoribosyltransferase [bacterium]
MIKEVISKVVDRKDLSQEEAYQTMLEIMEGEATDSQIASYITALRMKGETIDEITGSAKAMREKAIYVDPSSDIVLDTCGTGGDRLGLFNISTISAFVVAGCGVVVAKHGNRSVSSQCGSADLLTGFSVNINIPKEGIERCLREIGIGFLFAPILHPAMKYAISPRREIGIRSIFNILGPLCNPARTKYQVLGVYDEGLCRPLANVLNQLGTISAVILHSYDGADEATLFETKIIELYNGEIKEYTIFPEDFGLKKCDLSELKGGDVSENLKIASDILSGKEKGPKMDVVLLNSAIGLYVVRKAPSISDGIKLADESISSGSAYFKLNELKRISQEYSSF